MSKEKFEKDEEKGAKKKGSYQKGKKGKNTRGKGGKYPGNDTRERDFNAQESRPNDPRWYAQNEQLMRDTASIPYSWPLGNRLDLGPYATEINKGSLPGIMAIHTAPTFGYSDNPNSPINVAARNVYSFVRHANSGHANYDATDEMIYLMAMDSCYSFLSFVRRIYGVVCTYSFTNRYYPVAALNAMGVDFYNVQENLADFRAWINTIAVKFGSMCIPASMSYMAKHMWMYEGLYYDTPQDKPQTYLFVPDGFYRFTYDSDGAGMLTYDRLQKMQTTYSSKPINPFGDSTLLTVQELIDYGNSLINPILQSEDMNIMSGDILKAFGAQNLYMMNTISEDYTVLPVYEPEVLDQIQNLTMVGRFTEDRAYLIQSASKGWLEFMPDFHFPYQFASVKNQSTGENFLFAKKFITFDRGDITPDMTMEASRMTQICREHDESSLTWTYYTLASEVAMYAYIYYFAEDPADGEWKLYRSRTVHSANAAVVDPAMSHSQFTIPMSFILENPGESAVGVSSPIDVQLTVPAIAPQMIVDALNPMLLLAEQISQFSRHPGMALTIGVTSGGASITESADVHIEFDERITTSGSTITISKVDVAKVDSRPGTAIPVWGKWYGILEDINYYSIVDEANLINMAGTALLSMFNVTQYGRSAE